MALAATIGKQPLKAVSFLWTDKDNYHDPNGLIDEKRFQKNLDDLHKYGLLKDKVDASQYIDTSIVREAMARVHMN